jgi:hypothetical protein
MSNLTHASFHALNFLNLMFLRRLNLCWTVPRSLAVILPRLPLLSKRCRPCKLATAWCFKSVITARKYSEVACAPPIDFSQAAPPNKPTTLPCIRPLKKRGHGPRWVASSVAGQNTIQTASSAAQDVRSVRAALLEGASCVQRAQQACPRMCDG